MEKLLLTLHIIVCVILVLLVLLQSGKEGMGVIFGGGSASLFGGAGAGGILVRLTTFVAVIFFATSLGYNILTGVKTSKEEILKEVFIDEPAPPASALPPASGNASVQPAPGGIPASPAD